MRARSDVIYGFPFAGEFYDATLPEYDTSAYETDPDQWLCDMQGAEAPPYMAWKVTNTLPIGVERDGDMSRDVTTDYLCINEATIHGDWDAPTEIRPELFLKMPEWDELLRKFCEKAEIPFQQPKWWLLSSMG